MDLRKVKKLIELLEESALVEMEISEGDSTIRLSRASSGMPVNVAAPPQIVSPVAQEPPINRPEESSVSVDSPAVANGPSVDSPMVGTFYSSPSPEDPAYVEVGATVKEGDVVCIIEAMKTFNQIKSDVSGTIKAIHKQDGDPVEFGEPLFTIA